MADLNPLYDALALIRQNRKTAKVFFYFVNKVDGRMQSGFILISEGMSCYINYFNKSNENALNDIAQLNLTKVMSLPATLMDVSSQPFPACELDMVLQALRPASLIEPHTTMQPDAPLGQVEPAALAHSNSFYSHVAIRQEAFNLLESLFGPSAAQRVEEIALALPPQQYPIEFLNKCKLHASMMLGPRKAEEIFQLMYKKLANRNASINADDQLA